MREFGIEYLEGKMMFKLSEGERTRVLICRALMADPDLLILDERLPVLIWAVVRLRFVR